jgi:mannose-6-phosphate isomerase-like protein (cupin superfamily)
MGTSNPLEHIVLSESYDYIAPDGSEIRLLSQMRGGGICHCTLPPGAVSAPVYHKAVEEIWYFISGDGELWRKPGAQKEPIPVRAGVSVPIPPRTTFQFRNTGNVPLCFIVITMPPWPGPDEAGPAEGLWTPTVK